MCSIVALLITLDAVQGRVSENINYHWRWE